MWQRINDLILASTQIHPTPSCSAHEIYMSLVKKIKVTISVMYLLLLLNCSTHI